MRFLKSAIVSVLSLAVLAFLLGWIFLSSGLMSGSRNEYVEGLLSRQLKHPVEIDGDVRVGFLPVLNLSAQGIRLPDTTAEASAETPSLAEVGALSFDLPIRGLWHGGLEMSNLKIDGVSLRVVVDADGKSGWADVLSGLSGGQKATGSDTKPGLQLLDDKISLSDARVLFQDARSGADLDLQLAELTFDRGLTTKIPTLKGTGTLNGESLELDGLREENGAFDLALIFEHMQINVDGKAAANDLTVNISAEIAELGQLQDAAKLNRVLEGEGRVSLVLTKGEGKARIDDLNVTATLDGGQSVQVTGSPGELGNPDDVSLVTLIRLYPEDARPPVARLRRDLKLIAVEMVMDAKPGQVAQRGMLIETNGFTLTTSGEGPPPFKASQISRTPDGNLKLGKVTLRIGNPSDPFLILDGVVKDTLQLQDISGVGQLDVAASSLVAPERLSGVENLGRFAGLFRLNGGLDKLTLSELEGQTEGTDLWNLQVSGTVENVLRFEDLDLNIEVDVPSSADLMEAMKLKPVDAGHTALWARVKSQGTDWNAEAGVRIGGSDLEFTLDLDDAMTAPVMRGLIDSDLIQLDHLRKIISAAIELRKLDKPAAEGDAETSDADDSETSDPKEPSPVTDLTLQPIGRAVLLSGIDLDLDIDLRKIEGSQGISTLQSELVLKDKHLKAGPLKFEYGGGQFDVSGEMDLNNTDHILNLTGQAGGWKLDDLLESLNFRKGASGTLHGQFDIAGQTSSIKDFLGSLDGSATLSMSGGSIETQLLDLAGLGVLPWLFSDKQKVAPITCLHAPIAMASGTVSTKRTTLETDQVQIVVFGGVDLSSQAIDINVQPRKIGEPLKRSPWPFTVDGTFKDPKIQLKEGPRKLKRSDGADKMPANRKPCVPDILQLQ
ncbi:MAG: AsmA family protein [Paracoccaceae bacterium]